MQSLQCASNSAMVLDCAREVLDVVPGVLRPLRQQMRSHRSAGLSIPQFRALCYVERYDGASLSAVAEHLDLSLPTVSRMVNGLVERGFLQRRSGVDDRRHMRLSVRPRGQAVMADARGATQQFLSDKFHALSFEQLETLLSAMHTLRDVFAQEMPRPAPGEREELAASR